MNLVSLTLLITSILLSMIRNILSKNISKVSFGTKKFFFTQAVIFAFGSIALMMCNKSVLNNIASLTFFYSVGFGVLLVSAQWCLTLALKKGKVSICFTVYGLGFIFPALSGSMFWNERLTSYDIIGVLTVVTAIILQKH